MKHDTCFWSVFGMQECIKFQNMKDALLCAVAWGIKWIHSLICSVWPDWAISWSLGNFLKPLTTISLAKSLTFLGNFLKGIKIYHFSSGIILGTFYRHLAIFSGHTDQILNTLYIWEAVQLQAHCSDNQTTSNFQNIFSVKKVSTVITNSQQSDDLQKWKVKLRHLDK